jgi:hypothetical protein
MDATAWCEPIRSSPNIAVGSKGDLGWKFGPEVTCSIPRPRPSATRLVCKGWFAQTSARGM